MGTTPGTTTLRKTRPRNSAESKAKLFTQSLPRRKSGHFLPSDNVREQQRTGLYAPALTHEKTNTLDVTIITKTRSRTVRGSPFADSAFPFSTAFRSPPELFRTPCFRLPDSRKTSKSRRWEKSSRAFTRLISPESQPPNKSWMVWKAGGGGGALRERRPPQSAQTLRRGANVRRSHSHVTRCPVLRSAVSASIQGVCILDLVFPTLSTAQEPGSARSVASGLHGNRAWGMPSSQGLHLVRAIRGVPPGEYHKSALGRSLDKQTTLSVLGPWKGQRIIKTQMSRA